ncbi:MAG: DUF503 domain-containing protein [Myxococcales bacterium]|nr:DUF503 domain-containing protein [Myxococcales bacterium]
MVVGVVKLRFALPGCASLKDKRRALRSLLDRARSRFTVAVGEVGALEDPASAELGLATVGNDRRVVNAALDQVVSFLDSGGEAVLTERTLEILNL